MQQRLLQQEGASPALRIHDTHDDAMRWKQKV
jgi:hypothetical protein